jgi:hypothetical protein
VGAKGTVTLDARFDCGFFVTVHVGRQEFQGMLYYPPQESAEVSLPATKCISVLVMIIIITHFGSRESRSQVSQS